MLIQCMRQWREQDIQFYIELVVRGCSNILQCWRDHRLEFPGLSDLAGNTFCMMASSVASEGVFRMDGHAVKSRRTN